MPPRQYLDAIPLVLALPSLVTSRQWSAAALVLVGTCRSRVKAVATARTNFVIFFGILERHAIITVKICDLFEYL